jgi:hypothetical protein
MAAGIAPAEAGNQDRQGASGEQDDRKDRAGRSHSAKAGGGHTGDKPTASLSSSSSSRSLSCHIEQLEEFPETIFRGLLHPQHGISMVPIRAHRGREEGRRIRLPSNAGGAARRVRQLGYDVGQQAEEAGALDRLGEFALLLLGNGRDAGRNDLAALGNVALQSRRTSL